MVLTRLHTFTSVGTLWTVRWPSETRGRLKPRQTVAAVDRIWYLKQVIASYSRMLRCVYAFVETNMA